MKMYGERHTVALGILYPHIFSSSLSARLKYLKHLFVPSSFVCSTPAITTREIDKLWTRRECLPLVGNSIGQAATGITTAAATVVQSASTV